jgi:tripartite-type tricarboxylate transporter receptor subunit TctC
VIKRFLILLPWLLGAFCVSVFGADFPNRAVTILVPFPPGGATDLQARLIAKGLTERLRTPVVVDNRPGAGGRIGTALAARAKADGYTLVLATISGLVIYPALDKKLPYDPLRDLTPVAGTVEAPFLLLVPSTSTVKTVADLLTRAGSEVSAYASWGQASIGHVLGEMLNAAAGIDLLHVPYKGEAPALMELIGGQVGVMFATTVAAMPHIRAGKVRALGVTSPRRLASMPDVPTLDESGLPGLNLSAWFALMAPAGTPAEVVARLRKEMSGVLGSAEFTQWVASQAAATMSGGPADIVARMRSESAAIRKLISTRRIQLDD